MGKSFWIILVVAVAVLVGVFVVFSENADAPSANIENPHEITETDNVKGAEGGKVTLVEYGDFQCPACRSAYPMIKDLVEEYPDDLKVVYRHFPLTQIHPQAYDAARASEAAAKQGKFWDMHDLLFERQDDWAGDPGAKSIFEGYAEELELDMDKYQDDLAGTSSRVDRDTAIAKQLEVSSTPTFFLDGKKIDNPRTYEEFAQLIEEAIAAAEQPEDNQ